MLILHQANPFELEAVTTTNRHTSLFPLLPYSTRDNNLPFNLTFPPLFFPPSLLCTPWPLRDKITAFPLPTNSFISQPTFFNSLPRSLLLYIRCALNILSLIIRCLTSVRIQKRACLSWLTDAADRAQKGWCLDKICQRSSHGTTLLLVNPAKELLTPSLKFLPSTLVSSAPIK